MSTYNISPQLQWASYSAAGVWQNYAVVQGLAIVTPANWWIVAVFNLTPANLPRTVVTSATFTLSNTQAVATRTHYVDLYGQVVPITADLSTSNPPKLKLFKSEAFTIPSVGGTTAVVQVDFPLYNSNGSATQFAAGLASHSGHTDSNGRRRWLFAMALNPSRHTNSHGADGCVITNMTLTYQEAFTGLSGPYQARGRADECPKCGGKSTRDTWVRDGYTKLMVCPHCYDEEDRVGQHYVGLGSERPGSGEG